MKKFVEFIIKQKYLFLGLFFVLLVASAVAMNFVNVNYDLTKYLPDDTSTKSSIQMMKDEFGASGTATIMVTGVEKNEGTQIALQLNTVEGVATASVSQYNEEQKAVLINIFLDDGDYTQEAEQTLNAIKSVLDENLTNTQNYYCTGSAVSAVASRTAISQEIPIILLIAVVIVLIILSITTRSWIEPVILLLVIGTAILINFGTNIIMGEISFISNSISAVLLIALAMDYSIVLVSRFREEREKNPDVEEAMKKALAGSMTTIIASGCTVMAGLISLVFMDYKIGMDMGLVLTKGVFISLLAVIFLMPAILILFSKIIKKTEHKSFLPGLKKVGTYSYKTRWIVPFVFIALITTAGIVQFSSLQFTYVAKFGDDSSQVVVDQKETEKIFGVQNTLVLMVDKTLTPEAQIKLANDVANITVEGNTVINTSNSFMTSGAGNLQLGSSLTAETLQYMFGISQQEAQMIIYAVNGDQTSTSVYAYKLIEGIANPQTQVQTNLRQYIQYMYPAILTTIDTYYVQEQVAYGIFVGDNKVRMIFNINAEADSEVAISYVNALNDYLNNNSSSYTNDAFTYNIVNNTQNVIETEAVFTSDRLKVELISIGAILLIVLIAFRRISLPVILVVAIQGALWINLAGNALLGNSIFFICYLLGTAIQMGATIDYGILLADRYKFARRSQDKKEAIKTAIDKSFVTIISSGSILTLAAFTIGIISTVPLISSIGYLVGFGALCALLTILFVLPQGILICDKFVVKKTETVEYINAKVIEDKQQSKNKKLLSQASNKKLTKTSIENKKQKNK